MNINKVYIYQQAYILYQEYIKILLSLPTRFSRYSSWNHYHVATLQRAIQLIRAKVRGDLAPRFNVAQVSRHSWCSHYVVQGKLGHKRTLFQQQ